MMDKLPNEILTKIFGYLSPEALHTVSQVSKSWSRVAKALGVCQLDFSTLGDEQHDVDWMVAKIMKEIPTEAARGSIRHVLVHCHRLLPHNIFSFIQHLCPNVISFDYNYDLFDTHYSIAQLDSSRHPFLASPSWRNSITHLPLCHDGREDLSNDTTICERLESLTIHLNSPLLRRVSRDYYARNYGFPSFPHLTSLTLDTPSAKFRETTINSIVDHLSRRLTTLTLRHLHLSCLFDRKNLVSCVSPNLQVLKLENVHFLNRQTYDYFPNKFPNVQVLTIFGPKSDIMWSSLGRYKPLFKMICQFKRLTNLKVRMHDGHLLDGISTIYTQRQIQSLYDLLSKDIHIDIAYT